MIKTDQEVESQLSKVVRLASEGLRTLWEFTTAMHDYLRDVASGASKAAPNQQKSRKDLVARLKKAYILPGAGGGEAAGVITELDLALIEGVARTLSRARTKVE